MKSSGKKARCDQPWTEWSVGKEMTRRSYDLRRDLIFAAHPEIRMVELGLPQDAPQNIPAPQGPEDLEAVDPDDESQDIPALQDVPEDESFDSGDAD